MSKLEKEGHNCHFGKVLVSKRQNMYSVCLLYLTKKKEKRELGKEGCSGQTWRNCNEREYSFSLEIRAIRPSAVFRTRRRTTLRGEGFAWVLDFGSFLKLREVGVSPYLGFIPYFKYFANV